MNGTEGWFDSSSRFEEEGSEEAGWCAVELVERRLGRGDLHACFRFLSEASW